MTEIILLISLLAYLIINYLFIVKIPKLSWLCIIIWYVFGYIFVTTTDASGWLLIENLKPQLLYLTIKILFTNTIIFGNIAVSIYGFLKK